MSSHALVGRRRRETTYLLLLIAVVTAAALIGSLGVTAPEAADATTSGAVTIFASNAKPTSQPTRGVAEVGTRFTVKTNGSIVALRYYRGPSDTSTKTATLWTAGGQDLANVTFKSSHHGWQTASLSNRVAVHPGVSYIVGYHADRGAYYQQRNALASGRTMGNQYIQASAGMIRAGGSAFPFQAVTSAFFADVVFMPSPTSGSSTPVAAPPPLPTPSSSTPVHAPTVVPDSPPAASKPPSSSSSGGAPEPVISGAFPSAATTGVPAGVALTSYTGPMTISSCTVISGKLITGNMTINATNGTASGSTPCVTIENSKLVGTISTGPQPGHNGPLVLSHVEVAPPQNSIQQGVIGTNFYLYNVNLHGGANGGVDCSGACGIYNSWIHDFYLAGATHYDGIISNGLYDNAPLVIEHNSIDCNFYATAGGASGGCSGDVGLYGDFAPTSNVTINDNLFLAATAQAYCLYGGEEPSKAFSTDTGVVVTNNTFQRGTNGKCGSFGPVAHFGGAGNTWSNNVWDNGGAVTP